jgi:tripartite-type tricarboxylate transporter receptor subunit TctC
MRTAKTLAACFAIGLTFLFGQGALSQSGRTIKIVVPFPAGGPGDNLARLLGEQISRTRGSTLVIESRPGASGRIGTEAVARVPPDGGTLLIVANNFLIDPHIRRVSYDPFTSFEPICYLTNQPYILAIDSQSPYGTFADLLGAARALPGSLTVAGVGPASTAQIAFEMLKHAADVEVTFVPFAGSAPAVTALLGSHVTAALVPYSAAAEHLKAGKLRALAAASERRVEPLPDVPALAEFGFRGIDADLWLAVFAPAKTSRESTSELISWFTAALQTPEVKAKLVLQGQFPVGMCGADFGAHLRRQFDDYGRIIREAGIKAE